jgi:hypothetical protein
VSQPEGKRDMAHPRPSAAENRGCDPESTKKSARLFVKLDCAGTRELSFIWLEGVSPGTSKKASISLVGCVINELMLEVIEPKSTSSKVRSSSQGFTISKAPLIKQGSLPIKNVT